jgi:hypothetical protein
MNALFEPAHSRFGGSNAGRTLHCPKSVQLIDKVPAHLRKISVYAEHGTALHTAITLLLDKKESFESLAGKTIGSCLVTDDDIENILRPILAYVEPLLNTPGAEFYLDLRVTFPTIAGAFGTLDLLVRIGSTVHVIDFRPAPACAFSRFIPTATMMSLTRN